MMSESTHQNLKTVAVVSALLTAACKGDVKAAAYRAMYAAEEAIKALNSAKSAAESLQRTLGAGEETPVGYREDAQ